MSDSAVYRHPRYYAIGYRWNTEAECDFIEASLRQYGPAPATATGGPGPANAKRLLDIGCGAGRHLLELAKRGYDMTGVDIHPEMVAYVQEEARKANLPVRATAGDLRRLKVTGTYDAAFCFMDTFRFLLTNEDILGHLRAVAGALVSGGLYLVDFWVPRQWDLAGNEVHQWEQTEGDTTVRVFYVQHPESIDPVTQTFDDELVFEVHDGGETTEIRGGRTRTRLILPQEFRLLVELSQAFELVGAFSEFDLTKPLAATSMTWRMVSVLRKR